MSEEDRRLAKMLLTIKSNAYKGMPWTQDQRGLIESSFEKEGEIRVLAACCVLSARRPEGCDRSLGILRETIERKVLPSAYTELLMYEALNYVSLRKLAPFYDALFVFIGQSLSR